MTEKIIEGAEKDELKEAVQKFIKDFSSKHMESERISSAIIAVQRFKELLRNP
jgi:hypothetical protein